MTLDVLEVTGIEVRCIVGVYPHERDQPQPLIVDLALHLDTSVAGEREQMSATVDYGRLAGEVRFLLESCRFRLLETAAEAIARYALLGPTADRPRAQVETVKVRLQKPEALGGPVAALTIVRHAAELVVTQEHKPFGVVDVVHESKDCGVYRLRVGPKRAIATHVHRRMDEHELILGSGLLLQGRPAPSGVAHHWPKGHPHRYDNPTDVEQTILCVDRPPFLEDDEIEVEEPSVFTLPASVRYTPA